LRKTQALFKRSLESLPKDAANLKRLEALVEQVETTIANNDCANAGQRIELALEIARRYETSGEFESAHTWMQHARQIAGEDAPVELLDECQFRFPLAWAQHALAAGEAATSVVILKEAMQHELAQQQQVAMQFLLAEALLAAGKREAARQAFDELAKSSIDEANFPEWQATVDLRRSELLILSRKYVDAQRLLEASKQKYVHFSAAYEFDYLLARCAIATIDFDAARQYLQQVINAPLAAGKEATARAGWMVGETYFLQHQYDQALASYRPIIDLVAFPTWQARARLQSAKCYELLGQPEYALRAYISIDSGLAEPVVVQEATERIAAIRSAVPVLR
jgi:tetratricopeptide (TPR) repeat protein